MNIKELRIHGPIKKPPAFGVMEWLLKQIHTHPINGHLVQLVDKSHILLGKAPNFIIFCTMLCDTIDYMYTEYFTDIGSAHSSRCVLYGVIHYCCY